MCLCVLKSFILLRFNSFFYFQECYEVVLKTLFEKSVSVEKVYFEQVPTSIYLLEKRIVLCSFPLDNAILLLVSEYHRRWSCKGSIRKGRTITKAMLGRLSNNPNVLRSISRQQFRGNLSEATLIFEPKEQPLKYPILNDRLPKATEVGVYPRSAHVRVIQFQVYYLCTFRVC